MKSEKGLTLWGTVILIVMIALMIFAVVYFTRIQVDKEETENLKTDMLLVQAKVKKISGDYTLEHKEEILIGTKLSDMQEDEIIKEFLEKKLFDANKKGKKYYVLNQQNLNDLELNKVILEKNSYYIAEYTTGEVYYTKGYTDENGDVHYKAKEEISQNNAEKNENNENNENTKK